MIPFILFAVGGAIIGNAFSSDVDKLSEGGVIVNKEGVGTDATDGGIFKGKRHSEGGIAVDVIGGSPVEVETDEALIKNGEANSSESVSFDGKKMTPREVLSAINQDYGGVPIKKMGGMLDTDIVKESNGSKEPVVVEGGSIVITRNAILDEKTKHDFNGKSLTNKEILSEINKMNGGVAFSKGGKVEKYEKGSVGVGGNVGLNNLKNIDGYVFELDKYNSIDNEKVFKINDIEGNHIGRIYIVDKDGAYHVENVMLNKERTGVGYDIYKKLITTLDKPINSGEVQNEKAKGLWDKLVKDGFAKKEGDGYISISKKVV